MPLFRANGFTSEIPRGWEDRSTIVVMGPVAADGFGANITVTRQALPEGTGAEAFGREQTDALAAEVDGLAIDDERTVERAGRTLFQRMHRFRIDGRPVVQVQTYLVHARAADTVGYVVTGTASPEAFDGCVPAFRRFVEEFRLDD